MMPDHPDWWDANSDQPYRLDKRDKTRFSVSHSLEYTKTVLTTIIAPLLWLAKSQSDDLKRKSPDPIDFVGLGISADRADASELLELISELGVRHLLIRVPAWHADQLEPYLRFAENFPDRSILINILQSRENISNRNSWPIAIKKIIESFYPITNEFQLGNAINRSKWGCRHVQDYLNLLDMVIDLREQFPEVILAGSSVIDFEPLATLRTLLNFHPYRLDVCSSLLYVNRRGAPSNYQFGVFNLENKIRLIASLLSISNKCGKRLWITETNWPLLDTQPFTPNSGHPRSTVDEPTQAKYLTDYYKIAWRTGLIERVYWWQLKQAGYGLIDHRTTQSRKMASFYALKKLLASDSPLLEDNFNMQK
ncbi:MAG: hypothetical protein CL398_02310 [Acidiferrobacteraceae bacterium]|nr:hypothetical protein [Acidiferrobacteraceae bacterium]